MKAESITQNKNIFTFIPSVLEIINPLNQFFKISYFQYNRFYKDNSSIILTTRGDWLQHCIENRYYTISYFESTLSANTSKNILWSQVNEISSPIFKVAKDAFNMSNGFSIINNYKDYTEYFHFASEKNDEKSVLFYLNNIDVLQRFILYFKEKSYPIVKKLRKTPVFYPEENLYDQFFKNDCEIKTYSKLSFNKSRYYFFDNNDVYLTKAEFECLLYLIKYGSIAQATKNTGVLYRTACAHINNVKEKLNCRTLFQLGQIISKSNFPKQFIL